MLFFQCMYLRILLLPDLSAGFPSTGTVTGVFRLRKLFSPLLSGAHADAPLCFVFSPPSPHNGVLGQEEGMNNPVRRAHIRVSLAAQLTHAGLLRTKHCTLQVGAEGSVKTLWTLRGSSSADR